MPTEPFSSNRAMDASAACLSALWLSSVCLWETAGPGREGSFELRTLATAQAETNGKNERFNGTLQAEVLRFDHFAGLQACQERFKDWRRVDDCERPHEAIGRDVPASRYRVSDRTYPEELPTVEYGPGDGVRQVNPNDQISFRSCRFKVGKALGGRPCCPTSNDH